MVQVFISYKHHDVDGKIAQEIYDLLRGWGFDAWMDVHNIPSGIADGSSGWIPAIDKGLRASQVLIGLISDDALISENVQREWQWALLNNRRIFLIKVRDFNRENMSHQFATTLYLNYPNDQSKLEADLHAFAQDRAKVTEAVTVSQERNLNAEILEDLKELEADAPKKRPNRPIHESPLFLRVIALLIFIVGLLWLITAIGFEPLLVMLGSIIPLLASFAVNRNEPMIGDEKTEERDWLTFKDRIRRYWLESLLRPTLQEAAALNIGLSAQPDLVIQHEKVGEIDLSGGSMDVGGIFNALRSFLIVGEAGAGKTVMLLQLATKLLRKPLPDFPKSLPLLLNLSSWGNDDIPLDEWLLREAEATYQIRRKTFSHWLKNKRLILLLDGLDEIRTDEADRRTMRDRIQKINAYRQAHPDMPMVICTRIAEYRISTDDDAKHKLNFDHAILVDPLTSEQIRAYMDNPDLDSLRQLYTEDGVVRDLAKIPFLLVTMTHTYRGLPKRQLEADDNTIPGRLDHIFRKYLTKQLQSHAPLRHDEDKIRQYLTWIATKTTAFGTVFRADRVTIEWFKDDGRLMHLYEHILMWSAILIPTILLGLAGYAMAGIIGALAIGGLGFFIGLVMSIASASVRFAWESIRQSDRRDTLFLIFIVPFSALITLLMPLFYTLMPPLVAWLLAWVMLGVVFGVVFREEAPYTLELLIGNLILLIPFMVILYTINQAMPHVVWLNALFSVFVTGITLFMVMSAEDGNPTASIPKRDWIGYIGGAILIGVSFAVIFPSVGYWWIGIMGVMVLLVSGILGNVIKDGVIRLYILCYLSRDYHQLVHDLTDRQILRPFGGGHTFRHDYLRQSFLGNSKIVVAQINQLINDLVINNHADWLKRESAIQAIRQFGAIAIDGLIAHLGNKDSGVRGAVAWALGYLGDARAVEPLIVRLDDRGVRSTVAEALGRIGDARAVEPLIARLDDSDSNMRRVVVEALEKLNWQPQNDDQIALLAFAKRDFDKLVEMKAVDFLIARLDSNVRRDVAEALKKIGAPAVDHLVPLLKGVNSDVRYAVADVLIGIGWQPQTPDETRWFALAMYDFYTLVNLKAVDFLIPLLTEANWYVRGAVAGALGKIGDERAVDHLIPMLKDEDTEYWQTGKRERVCDYVAKALRAIGTPEALQALRDAGFKITSD